MTRIERQHLPAWARCAHGGCADRVVARVYHADGWMLFVCARHLPEDM